MVNEVTKQLNDGKLQFNRGEKVKEMGESKFNLEKVNNYGD